MTEPEIRLKCLELALVQAKNENLHANRETVAEIQSRFYALVSGAQPAVPEPQVTKSRKKSDKSDLFD